MSTPSTRTQNYTSPPQPWAGQQPYLERLYARGEELSEIPMSYYPGSTVAGYGETTTGAMQDILGRASMGAPGVETALDLNRRIMGGEFLSPETNPYLRGYFESGAQALEDRFRRATLPELETRFAQAGGTGGSAYQGALGRAGEGLARGLSELATGIYGGAYETERERLGRAMEIAPALEEAGYAPLERARGIGREEDVMAQAKLEDLVARYEFGQMEPWRRLGLYQESLGGPIAGGGTSTSSVNQPFDWTRALLGLVGLRG